MWVSLAKAAELHRAGIEAICLHSSTRLDEQIMRVKEREVGGVHEVCELHRPDLHGDVGVHQTAEFLHGEVHR